VAISPRLDDRSTPAPRIRKDDVTSHEKNPLRLGSRFVLLRSLSE
jgi:hypothetical protein